MGDGIPRQLYALFSLGFILQCVGIVLIAWSLKTLINEPPQNLSFLVSLDTIGLIIFPLGLMLMGYAFLVK
jgi:hypothetical protein